MINGIAEQAVLRVFGPLVPQGLNTVVADEEKEKELAAPVLIIRATENESLIDPASGIFKVIIQLTVRLHLAEHAQGFAAEVTQVIDGFAFSTDNPPKEALSAVDGFHCYGFMPLTGAVGVDPEKKTYEYVTQWQLWCMPRNNS